MYTSQDEYLCIVMVSFRVLTTLMRMADNEFICYNKTELNVYGIVYVMPLLSHFPYSRLTIQRENSNNGLNTHTLD